MGTGLLTRQRRRQLSERPGIFTRAAKGVLLDFPRYLVIGKKPYTYQTTNGQTKLRKMKLAAQLVVAAPIRLSVVAGLVDTCQNYYKQEHKDIKAAFLDSVNDVASFWKGLYNRSISLYETVSPHVSKFVSDTYSAISDYVSSIKPDVVSFFNYVVSSPSRVVAAVAALFGFKYIKAFLDLIGDFRALRKELPEVVDPVQVSTDARDNYDRLEASIRVAQRQSLTSLLAAYTEEKDSVLEGLTQRLCEYEATQCILRNGRKAAWFSFWKDFVNTTISAATVGGVIFTNLYFYGPNSQFDSGNSIIFPGVLLFSAVIILSGVALRMLNSGILGGYQRASLEKLEWARTQDAITKFRTDYQYGNEGKDVWMFLPRGYGINPRFVDELGDHFLAGAPESHEHVIDGLDGVNLGDASVPEIGDLGKVRLDDGSEAILLVNRKGPSRT